MRTSFRAAFAATMLAVATVALTGAQEPQDAQERFRFRSGVELINVSASVTDEDGRFVSGLRKDDFRLFDDGELMEVSHFSNERVPVSLGIVLDTSGSMTADKMSTARRAIERFMALLGPDDELFLYRFANVPELVQPWTKDRRSLDHALGDLYAGGGTAMYDAIAEAVPLAQSGRNLKKAIVVISDGNDTGSVTTVPELRELIRQSEVLVYAIGVDGLGTRTLTRGGAPRGPLPIPIPFPGGRGGRGRPQFPPPIGGGGSGGAWTRAVGDRVDARALRAVTDDSGGRTEIVRDFSDLHGATSGIADELSKQYYLGYASRGTKDGKWHTIRVEVRDRRLTVRARKGYVAS